MIGFKDGTMYVKSPENNFRGIVPSAWLSKPEKDGFLYSSHCCLDVETSPTQWFYRSNWHPGVKDYFGTYKWTPEGGFVKERSIWAEDCQELPGGMGVAFV